jgi:hypothetical protein
MHLCGVRRGRNRRWKMRTYLCGLAVVVLVFGAFSGCARQRLSMMDARSDPAKLSPGEDAIICVRVIDTQGVVAAITATVREYPTMVLDLNDNGEEGDAIAGDGVWSFAIEVPGGAPAGVYNWDFEAFDANGDPVKVTTEEDAEEPLDAETSVEIVY